MNTFFILIILLLTAVQVNYAQEIGGTSGYPESIPAGRTGAFTLEEAPIQMNVPAGFKFLDAATAKSILYVWGNDSTSIAQVVGMIVPEDKTTAQDMLDMTWIVAYQTVGHVRDNDATKMGYSWIISEIMNSEDLEDIDPEWMWQPGYDRQHHRLSLPLMYISGTDTLVNHRQYIFGNNGVVQVCPITTTTDLPWLKKNSDLIANSIGFTKGERYEDFDSANQNLAYNSVFEYLKGIPADSTASAPAGYVEREPEDSSSSSPSFIGILGIAALGIVAIMLALMLAVALTNKRNETRKDIFQSGLNVLLRIGVFWMVYLLILTFAIFLIWAGVWVTIGIVTHYISVRTILLIIGGWVILGGFLWAILRSLFVFSKSEDPNRMEISESDAPKLFALIKEISESAGEKMPKHVYVSPYVNACVFYDRPLRNLLFNGRKNLEVGLGLLFGLNRQELKAIIAHEYGHFGQKSMRIGQIVSVSYNVISNLVNSENASIVRPVLRKTFLYVQRGFLSLSRSMEYEADAKSAKVAGGQAAVSALCKVGIIAQRFDAYGTLAANIYESKKILPSSYWNGYRQFLTLTAGFDGIILDETVTAAVPLSKTPQSRVRLKNAWVSHPLLEQRIESIRSLGCPDATDIQENIQDAVSQKVYDETSRLVFMNAEYISGRTCPDEEYRALLAVELDENSFPLSMRVFFNRELCGFKVNDGEEEAFSKGFDDVFSEANTHAVESFGMAISDYQTMAMFKQGATSERQIQYDGAVYSRKKVPVETQLQIVKELEPKIAAIDKDVCLLAVSKADDRNLIVKAYDDIFYSQAIIRHINQNLIPQRDEVAKTIGSGGEQNEKIFNQIQQILLGLKATIAKLIEDTEIERLYPVMHVNVAESLKRVYDDILLTGPSIDSEEIQYIFSLPEILAEQFRSLAYYSKKIVSDTIEGKAPLMYWNNSVASSKP